ncbi:uncharacterized protein LOC130736986 [Lotus japonicus]|uniref:uncharacterized protein LOC130736986 n=1 Tax=Lotus japonicus TaxID=34305 RepID=UPI00258E9093|nr:uncharacterized protein LOC130736986 [Lotus japonicus]
MMLQWSELRNVSDRVVWDMFPYALVWTIWLERNAVTFNNKEFSVQYMWDLHIARVAWWVKASWKSCPYSAVHFAQGPQFVYLPKPVKTRIQQQWKPPAEPILKLNVDSSSLGTPGRSGVGGVLRNHRGMMVGYFALHVEDMWAYEAEVHAIYQALLFSEQFKFKTLVIESDSTLAVGWVANRGRRPWKLFQILSKIDHLMQLVNCLSVTHVLRECNGVADILAKSGRDGSVVAWQVCDEGTPFTITGGL